MSDPRSRVRPVRRFSPSLGGPEQLPSRIVPSTPGVDVVPPVIDPTLPIVECFVASDTTVPYESPTNPADIDIIGITRDLG